MGGRLKAEVWGPCRACKGVEHGVLPPGWGQGQEGQANSVSLARRTPHASPVPWLARPRASGSRAHSARNATMRHVCSGWCWGYSVLTGSPSRGHISRKRCMRTERKAWRDKRDHVGPRGGETWRRREGLRGHTIGPVLPWGPGQHDQDVEGSQAPLGSRATLPRSCGTGKK